VVSRKHGVDMWVVPMREYNEDPVFSSAANSAKRRVAASYRQTLHLSGA
jgi:hypothetical protein